MTINRHQSDNRVQDIIRASRKNVERPVFKQEPYPNCRRRSPRQRVLKGAKITFNDYYESVSCRVVSQSEHGVMLRMDYDNLYLNSFKLTIPMDRGQWKCRVVQRDLPDVRVEFVSEKEELDQDLSAHAKIPANPFVMAIE